MRSFKITVKAKEDLIGIARFTEARWGRDQRVSYLKKLDEAFNALAASTDLGRACPEVKSGYWKCSLGSHIIFYRLASDVSIEIVRVVHKRMDLLRGS